MAFEFDDEIDQTSDENSEEQETYYAADTAYGRLGDYNVSEEYMPVVVSKLTGMGVSVKSMTFPDLEAMVKIVAQTCTAEFHKHKGYLDCAEESAITFRELLKLLEVKLHNSTTRIGDIVIELEDCFIYVHSGKPEDKVVINPEHFIMPTNDTIILYIFTEEVSESLRKKREYREKCETMFNRLKNGEKPVLVFNWVDSISRGGYSFSAPAILRNLGEPGFEHILQFQGIYEAADIVDNSILSIRKVNGRFSSNSKTNGN